jgi:tetratricopeptide (TPR) repeat protein
VGAGFRQWGVGIDYAVNFEDTDWQGPVEMLMRLGLSYRFGQSLDERKAEEAQRIKRQVDEGIKEATRQYEQQLDQLAEQYDREREQLEQQFEQRYQDRLQDLDAQIQDERQEILADVSAQFEAEKQQALDELAEEFEQQRAELELALVRQQNVYENRIGQLQNQFEQERQNIRQEAVADEAFKSERYARGLQLYSDGQYEEALAEFETVARYDDEYLNVQEYINRSEAQLRDVSSYSPEIMQLYYNGIDLFVQQEYRQAIAEWQKILDLDPYNKLAIRNIKEARDRLRRLQEMGIDE